MGGAPLRPAREYGLGRGGSRDEGSLLAVIDCVINQPHRIEHVQVDERKSIGPIGKPTAGNEMVPRLTLFVA